MSRTWVERRKLASGQTRYRVKFRIGGAGTTKRYGGTFKTARDAAARAQWIEGEMAARRLPDLSWPVEVPAVTAPTFREAGAAWLAARIDVSEGTKVQNRTSVGRSYPLIGDRRLDELEPRDIADLVVQLHTEGVKIGYLRKVVQAVAMVFDYHAVSPNPARDKVIVRMPHAEEDEVNPPSAEHVEAVYHLLPSAHRLPLLFLDWSAARVSAIDLTLVSDYDEPRRRVRLRASTTKQRRALWIDLPEPIALAVEASMGPREDRDPNARLFGRSGADALRTAIAKACKAAAIPLWSPHDLRHRRISLLHLKGVPWVRIGEFVGQRNIATTANVYSHVMLDTTELDYPNLLKHARS